MIKGIIFDYGGTLDSGGDHWSEVIWDAYQKCDVAVDKPKFREAYVYAERELAQTLYILPHHKFDDLMQIKIQIELEWLSEHGAFPPAQVEPMSKKIGTLCYLAAKQTVETAKPMLDSLKKKYKMVLVSNFYGNINSVLEDFGLDGYFSSVIESAVVGVRKPDPKIFEFGVKKMNLNPEEVVVVGDSYRKDILPARKIGCKTIWLKGKGWTADEDNITDPDTIASIAEVEAKIQMMD